MTKFSRMRSSRRALLRTGLVVAAGLLVFTPQDRIEPLRTGIAALLRPGQVAVRRGVERLNAFRPLLTSWLSEGWNATRQESELAALRAENTRLQAELNWLVARTEHEQDTRAEQGQARLLSFDSIPAMVLGGAARRHLSHHGLLSVGQDDGVSAEELVIDRGSAAGVGEDDWLLEGQAIWGRVIRAGAQTSTVREVTARDYRDVVEIVHRTGASLVRGPRGVLEGTGETLCRIRLVPTTEG